MMPLSLCMGAPWHEDQCKRCARLPLAAKDEEEAEKWIDWKKRRRIRMRHGKKADECTAFRKKEKEE